MKITDIDILIVNCNTTVLTNIAIASILKYTHGIDFKITVFDNSYAERFSLSEENRKHSDRISVIDNTKWDIINFKSRYNESRNRNLTDAQMEKVNQGSFKHMSSVQWFMDNACGDNLLLFDSDIILKRDVDFLDDMYLTVSDIELNLLNEKPGDFQIRFRPFIQYFNIKEMKRRNIRYFEPEKEPDYGRDEKYKSLQFDTGTAFFLKCLRQKNTTVRNINSSDYIFHMFAGTRRFEQKDIEEWKKIAEPFIT